MYEMNRKQSDALSKLGHEATKIAPNCVIGLGQGGYVCSISDCGENCGKEIILVAHSLGYTGAVWNSAKDCVAIPVASFYPTTAPKNDK